jgi:hypothetical protein
MAHLKVVNDTAAQCDVRRPSLNPNTFAFENNWIQAANTSASSTLQPIHRQIIDFTALPVSLSDTNFGGGTLIFTFPQGRIRIYDAMAIGVTPTTTSTIASTLKASKTLSVGVGTVQTTTQQSGIPLATTQQDIVGAFAATSSATINIAGTGGNGVLATSAVFDGTTTAIRAFLNFSVATGDIDGDATITVAGRVIIPWSIVGDY